MIRTSHRLFTLLLVTLILPCHATIIVIHGSFSSNSKWYRPRGAFYEALRKTTDEAVIPFSWSGQFLPTDIISDTGYLAELLLALDSDEPITIVAHSNGGNLCLYTTLLIKELLNHQAQLAAGDGAVRSVQPVPTRLLQPFQSPRRMNNHSADASIHECVATCFERLKKQIAHKPLRSDREHFIKAIYLMGTPFNIETFPVDMDVVEHVYNFYSINDFVQGFAGDRHLPNHERMANLHVSVTDQHTCEECLDEDDEPLDEHTTINPCHGCLHAPLVGRWFLHIPELIQAHPETTGVQDGHVWFHPEQAPRYEPGQVPQEADFSQTDQDSEDSE